jgi:hypothetical protein
MFTETGYDEKVDLFPGFFYAFWDRFACIRTNGDELHGFGIDTGHVRN